jgi:hypothetical protein
MDAYHPPTELYSPEYAAEKQRSLQQQTDMLRFQDLVERYGADVTLTWWKNCVAMLYGHTLAPGTIQDPRR